MHAFKDAKGRDWIVIINVTAVKRVRALTGVDLPGLVGDGGLGGLLEDVVKFVDVLFALVKPDADREKLTDEDFGSAMGGDALEKAAGAFVEELIDFFPAPRRGPLREMLAKSRQVTDALLRMAGEEAAELDPEEEAQKIYGRLKQRTSPQESNDSSGDTPEPSESTPEDSPSGS